MKDWNYFHFLVRVKARPLAFQSMTLSNPQENWVMWWDVGSMLHTGERKRLIMRTSVQVQMEVSYYAFSLIISLFSMFASNVSQWCLNQMCHNLAFYDHFNNFSDLWHNTVSKTKQDDKQTKLFFPCQLEFLPSTPTVTTLSNFIMIYHFKDSFLRISRI